MRERGEEVGNGMSRQWFGVRLYRLEEVETGEILGDLESQINIVIFGGQRGSRSLWQWSLVRTEAAKEGQPVSDPTEHSLTADPQS